jgi:hypothetical protein
VISDGGWGVARGDYKKPEDIIGENGLLNQLTKALMECALEAEMTCHLGYPKHDPAGRDKKNSRNGKSVKTVQGDFGSAIIGVPRDRDGSFTPQILPKGQRRFIGFDDKIIPMCSRGMTAREIQAQVSFCHVVITLKSSRIVDAPKYRRLRLLSLDIKSPLHYSSEYTFEIQIRLRLPIIQKSFQPVFSCPSSDKPPLPPIRRLAFPV